MEFRRFSLIFAVLAGAFLFSCKKENTDTTKLYMNGKMTVGHYTYYIKPGETVYFHPSGITHPEGKALGLSYKSTDKGFEFLDTLFDAKVNPYPAKGADIPVTYPDSLASFTVTFTFLPIDSDKYYTASASAVITTVNEESIPQVRFDPDEPFFPDDAPGRGGDKYNFVYLGGAYWMTQNLRYPGLGVPFDHCEAARLVFGNFYTWEEAVKACPENWRLPTDEDWAAMAASVNSAGTYKAGQMFRNLSGRLMADAYFNGVKMWEFWPGVKITNTSGLSMIPVGYFNSATYNDFYGANEYACFWTADTNPEHPDQAYYRYVFVQDDIVKLGSADKSSTAMSVRCIRDNF